MRRVDRTRAGNASIGGAPELEYYKLQLTETWAAKMPTTEVPLFVYLSKVDHALTTERDHIRTTVASKSKMLTGEEFASLLVVGNTSAHEPPAVIPAAHSARLIGLGYMADLGGRLRMTTPGRRRITAGFENRPLPISN